MTATTTTADATRERNERAWHASGALLYAGRIEEFLEYWQPDGRFEGAYPVAGLPAVVEGREALGAVFGGLTALTTTIAVHDVHFHQTGDPDVAFVEERMTADLVGGGRYENRLAIRVTFRDGLIAEMFEYFGQIAHAELAAYAAAAA